MKIKKRIFYNIIFCFVIIVISLSLYSNNGSNQAPEVLITNFLIIILSLFFMTIGDRYNFSLNKIIMLFSFFFFGIAPLIQYQFGITMWGGSSFSDSDYFKTNVIIIFILIIYQLLYKIFTILKFNKFENNLLNKSNTSRKLKLYKLLIISTISLLITLYVYDFNITNLIFRGIGIESNLNNQTIMLLYKTVIRPIPIMALFIFKGFNSKHKVIEILLIASVVITNFPTAISRFSTAALYIPLLLIYFKSMNKYMRLNTTLMLGLLIVFPFLDQARYIRSIGDFSFNLNFEMFKIGHFDSYQMFMRVISEDIVTYGQQLITAILFFIPRSIWSNKSVGSGQYVARISDFRFDNVSMNFFGEGYINFGYFGVLLFVFFIALFNARFDKMYWNNKGNNHFMYIYFITLGMEFFILRGDLLSGFAYVTGYLVSIITVYKIASN